jgi:sugar lactone lactonase YvrE
VQYFDKARMEITNPAGDTGSIWYVTNGLLVVELISGRMQVGDNSFQQRSAASVNVAGDADDPTGPTYATFGSLLTAAPAALGTTLTNRVNRAGQVTADPALTGQGLTVALIDEVTNHAIAAPFWSFMTSSGTVWDGTNYVAAPLFENAYFATGRPITEAYWANVKVGGTYQDVLMQCFERRCLTYNPANAPEWRVEAGNVGRHYYAWRYPQPGGQPTATPTQSTGATPATSASPSPSVSPSPTETPIEVPAGYAFERAWGSEIVEADRFDVLTDVALDPDGDFWAVDSSGWLLEFDAQGHFKRAISAQDLGEEPIVGIFQAVSIASDGTIYLLQQHAPFVQVLAADGSHVTSWGSGGAGDGQLDSPFDIVVTDSPVFGHLIYVSDGGNDRIELFDGSGNYVGQWGSHGSGDGQFDNPRGIALDKDGNVYVTDSNNARIQIFTASGAYLHQLGSQGSGDGQFNGPTAVAVDFDLNVFVLEQTGNRVQAFAPGGTFVDSWGSEGYGFGQLQFPLALVRDDVGNVYVADTGNHRLQKFLDNGQFVFLINDTTRGLIGLPGDATFDASGHLLIAENFLGAQRIDVYHTGGDIYTDFRPPSGSPDEFAHIGGIALGPQGMKYVVDTGHSRVEIFGDSWFALGQWGSAGAGPGQFDVPRGIAIGLHGYVYVVDAGNSRIQKFDLSGEFIASWGAPGSGNGQLKDARDIAIDDVIYVTDSGNNRVQVFSLDGSYLGQWGSFGSAPGQFDQPTGIAVGPDGYIFVVDSGNNRIQKFSPTGTLVAMWGTAGSGDGQFNGPWGIAVGYDGRVYVTDPGNHRVQAFMPVD